VEIPRRKLTLATDEKYNDGNRTGHKENLERDCGKRLSGTYITESMPWIVTDGGSR